MVNMKGQEKITNIDILPKNYEASYASSITNNTGGNSTSSINKMFGKIVGGNRYAPNCQKQIFGCNTDFTLKNFAKHI